MNKKGFTLVELLCVIILLALITTLASSSIINLSKNSKKNLYCTKVTMIEAEAKTYGEKYEKELNNSTNYYQGYKSLEITVNDLVENGNLIPDKDNLILSPLDNSSMNNTKITLYLMNNRINAKLENNICEN